MPRPSNRFPRPCVTCGVTFMAKPAEVARRGGKYCSRACYYASQGVPLEVKFRQNVGDFSESGCLLWAGALDKKGYGIVYSDLRPPQRLFLAHRLAWEFANGPIPAGMHVLHRCDNPPCVNVDHLFLGSHRDNMLDMASKGRHHNQKLTPGVVQAIRDRYEAGGVSQQQLADEYGTHQTNISTIVRRAGWVHVK